MRQRVRRVLKTSGACSDLRFCKAVDMIGVILRIHDRPLPARDIEHRLDGGFFETPRARYFLLPTLRKRREIFADVIAAQDDGARVNESRRSVAARWGIHETLVGLIEEEGIARDWPMPEVVEAVTVPV